MKSISSAKWDFVKDAADKVDRYYQGTEENRLQEKIDLAFNEKGHGEKSLKLLPRCALPGRQNLCNFR